MRLMKSKSRSVALSVLVSMLLVALVPLLIMAVQGYHCASMAVVELQTAHLRSVLEARKSRIEDWLREREADLSALANYPCTLEECTRRRSAPDEGYVEVCELLSHAHARSDSYESLVVYSLNWQRQNASKQTEHTDEKLLRPHFREALEESLESVVTPPHFHENGMFALHMGCPVYGNSSNKVGYMVAVLDLSTTVYPILRDRAGFGETTRTYIVSSDGRYFSQPSKGVHRLEERAPLPDALLAGDRHEPQTYEDCMGRTVIGVSTQIPALRWILVAEVDRTEAFAWLASLRRRAAVTGVFALALVMFLALRSAHRVTAPLKKLAAVAKDVSAGHFEKRLGHLKGREPQEVAAAFNSMLDELASTHRDLVQAASLAAVGELSSSIVHEMRNPLSSVKLNVKALRERVADDEMYAELATIASEQADRLEQMLNDLLQYGKPLEMHVEPVKVAAILDDVCVALAALSNECEVELRGEDRTNGRSVRIDREQLRRAVTNLGDNALRASAKSECVTIVGTVERGDAGEELIICVEDSGTGLSETVLPRLFEPFFTARGDGTGLGLANVRKIAELHGGTVTGENRPEGGARFTVRLPMGDGT